MFAFRVQRGDTDRQLRLLREVHLRQEGLEAGVGAEGVELRPSIEPCHHAVVFLSGVLKPGDGLIVVAKPQADPGQHYTTDA